MAFEDPNYDQTSSGEGDEIPEESNNNRTFFIAVGILGGVILLSLLCIGLLFFLRSRGTAAPDQAAAVAATQTAAAYLKTANEMLTATFKAAILPTVTLTPTATATLPVGQPSATPTFNPQTPSATISSESVSGTQSAATSTVAAALTKAATAQTAIAALPTGTAFGTPSALGETGIADEYGLPGMVVMALALILIILFARRLRNLPA